MPRARPYLCCNRGTLSTSGRREDPRGSKTGQFAYAGPSWAGHAWTRGGALCRRFEKQPRFHAICLRFLSCGFSAPEEPPLGPGGRGAPLVLKLGVLLQKEHRATTSRRARLEKSPVFMHGRAESMQFRSAPPPLGAEHPRSGAIARPHRTAPVRTAPLPSGRTRMTTAWTPCCAWHDERNKGASGVVCCSAPDGDIELGCDVRPAWIAATTKLGRCS